MKKVTIETSNNQKLIGTLFYPHTERSLPAGPAVLFIPGWTSSEASYHERAKALTELGYICLTISLRGHGESSGTLENFSRADHMEDVLHAYDFLSSQKNVDPKNISAIGASYGGYIAAVLAGKRNIHHLVLRAPAFYYNKNFTMPTATLLANREKEFFQHLAPEKDNVALLGVTKIHGQLLVIESEHDQIIPNNIMGLYMLVAGSKSQHKLIRFADHQLSQGEWKQAFITMLQDFFINQKNKT